MRADKTVSDELSGDVDKLMLHDRKVHTGASR